VFLGFLVSAGVAGVLIVVLLGCPQKWGFVAGFVDLVERTGCALA